MKIFWRREDYIDQDTPKRGIPMKNENTLTYYERHREEMRQQQREYYRQNRKKVCARARRRYWKAKVEAAASSPTA